MKARRFVIIGCFLSWILAVLLPLFVPQVQAIEDAKIKTLANKVNLDVREAIVKRRPLLAAINAGKSYLLAQPGVRTVSVYRQNMFLTFDDGRTLLMLLGRDRLGGGLLAQKAERKAKLKEAKPIVKSILPKPIPVFLMPCVPGSDKAIILDALADDANVVTPHAWRQVKSDLEALGYTVTVKNNDRMTLAFLTRLEDGEYGVIFFRTHGGVFSNKLALLTRPWYNSYPSPAHPYTGTGVASAYCHSAGGTRFAYYFNVDFINAYLTSKPFPGSMVFLESCHGADPAVVDDMPVAFRNKGATSGWVGWDESVSFISGDHGSAVFFDNVRQGKSIGQAISAVEGAGYSPDPHASAHPRLKVLPSGAARCKLDKDRITNFRVISQTDASVTFRVNYHLASEHSVPVFIGAKVPAYEHRDAKYFGYRPSKMSRGNGWATVRVSYGYHNAPDRYSSRTIEAGMYEGGGKVFYKKSFPFRKTWKLGITHTDPNERGVPDGKDFKSITLSKKGNDFKTALNFYGNIALAEFYYYFNTDPDPAAEILIRCRRGSFEVAKETQPGLYDNVIYRGTPTVAGRSYTLTLPWSTVFGRLTEVKLWLFAMDGRDRLPNVGNITFSGR